MAGLSEPIFLLFTITFGLWVLHASAELQRFEHPSKTDGSLIFLVVGDWGRRGDYNQSEVAFQMGKVGEKLDVDFVISTGDNFYDDGLTGQHDTAFVESFTNIYTSKSLQKQWFSVLGNHDYRGDALAQLGPVLGQIDSRWLCSRSFIVDSGEHRYDWRGILPRKSYHTNLLKDVELVLRESTAKWKIVVGHHAIRSVGHHGDTKELVKLLLPILQANDVDFYMNGHDHCLEHISDIHRGDVKEVNRGGLNFFYDGQGFMSVQLTQTDANIEFYDVAGKVLHRLTTSKQLHTSM